MNNKQAENLDLYNSIRDEYLSTGHLPPCPDSPNCVCSEHSNVNSHVDPLVFKGDPEEAWETLRNQILHMGGNIREYDEVFLHATFRSRIFGFIDDVNCSLDKEKLRIDIRSASRVGYSDFGVNRKRMETLREKFMTSLRNRG